MKPNKCNPCMAMLAIYNVYGCMLYDTVCKTWLVSECPKYKYSISLEHNPNKSSHARHDLSGCAMRHKSWDYLLANDVFTLSKIFLLTRLISCSDPILLLLVSKSVPAQSIKHARSKAAQSNRENASKHSRNADQFQSLSRPKFAARGFPPPQSMFKLSLHVLFSLHHCTLHTAHRTNNTAHCRLNIAYLALNAPNCTQQCMYTAY